MTIYMNLTRENVADLRAGDVVRYSGHRDLHGAMIEGPLYESNLGGLDIGPMFAVRLRDGGVYTGDPIVIEVVSRAPRPLYVNHPRTEPAAGDVVREADDLDKRHWMYVGGTRPWCGPDRYFDADSVPTRLRLLVDGETGQVVPSTDLPR